MANYWKINAKRLYGSENFLTREFINGVKKTINASYL